MTREQFNNLKVGDVCVIGRGHDVGRLCDVVYMNKEDNIILVRSSDGQKFNSLNDNGRNHRLLNWREVLLSEKEEA